MESGDLFTLVNRAFLNYGLLFFLVLAALGGAAFYFFNQRQLREHEQHKKALQALRYELEEYRYPTGPKGERGQAAVPAPMRQGNRIQFEMELRAYKQLWAKLRDLHDKLGVFLRTIEANEPTAESRLAAREAALAAKESAQSLRPFYEENIESLVFQIVDNEVQMHLSACAFLDRKTDSRESSDLKTLDSYQSLREESKLIYDGECRQQLNTLVKAIRQRLIDLQAGVD